MMVYSRQALPHIAGIVGIALLCTPLHSQTSNLPPGVIDGAKTPDLIADSTAFRLVFLSLRVPKSPTDDDLQRQESHFKLIGLANADKIIARSVLTEFDTAYNGWQTKYLQANIPSDVGAATSEREAIVQETTARFMNQLSPAGATELTQFVKAAKARMRVLE